MCSTQWLRLAFVLPMKPWRRNLYFFLFVLAFVGNGNRLFRMRSTLKTILRLVFCVCAVCVASFFVLRVDALCSWQQFGGPTDEEMRISIYLVFWHFGRFH